MMANSWQDEYKTMIEDCENRSTKLSDWEHDFIQSLGEQLDNGKTPSPKQIEKLNSIWERVT
jgi:hypothetical protein